MINHNETELMEAQSNGVVVIPMAPWLHRKLSEWHPPLVVTLWYTVLNILSVQEIIKKSEFEFELNKIRPQLYGLVQIYM